MKRQSRLLAALGALLAGGAIVGLARLRAGSPRVDRRPPPWGWALVGLAILAALVLVGPEYLESQARAVQTAKVITSGDPTRAPWLFVRYGCSGCHTIPGIPGAYGKVGPPLKGLFERVYIGGTAENTTDNLAAWIVNPTQFSPHTAMPPTGISTDDARDIAAYLYTH